MIPILPSGAPGPAKNQLLQTPEVAAQDDQESGLTFEEGDFESPEVFELITNLGSPDSGLRTDAINELRNNNDLNSDPNIFDALIELLSKGDIVSRRASAQILGSLNNTRAISPLAKALQDKDNELVLNSIDALETIVLGNKNKISQTSIDLLAKILVECLEENEYYDVSVNAAMLLGQLEKAEAVEMLATCLRADNDISRRERARDILCGIKDKKTLEEAIPLLSDEYDMRTREYAASIIAKLAESNITSDEATSALAKCSRDPNARLRSIAEEFLRNTKIQSGELLNDLILTILNNEDPEAVKKAAIAISGFNESVAAPVLYNIFSQAPDLAVKLSALEALVRTKNPIIVPALLVAIRIPNKIQTFARNSLQSLSDEILDKGLNKYLLEEPDIDNRFYLLVSLFSIDDPRVIPYVLKCMAHDKEDPRVKPIIEEMLQGIERNNPGQAES
ncbi:MAG: HEAT repeat domain-containing protein [Candidatus Melainabacteria bacterium]|nr:HEAT repeat domain-containing protein [Candidatus Melainabacteria bacterium]